ncbi:CAP domain-containing protein [Stieleria sp. JC731]|uniref:CAP domain-containing protein n=1 Tax=Roseiconus sp. JC912 TaxID=3396307 RepID=UPI003A4C5125|nr:CAP domain-containing protein [Stieleria sp. JC731]
MRLNPFGCFQKLFAAVCVILPMFISSVDAQSVTSVRQASPSYTLETYRCQQCGRLHERKVSVEPVRQGAETSVPTGATQPQSAAVVTVNATASAQDRGVSNAAVESELVTKASQNSADLSGELTVRSASGASVSGSISRERGGIQNVLSTLNQQRQRKGLRALRFDPALQAVAERRAQMMASMGTKSHPPGSFSPGRYEGVGWSSSYSPNGVHACYTSDPRMTVAGAAMATGRDGVYFAVVYR